MPDLERPANDGPTGPARRESFLDALAQNPKATEVMLCLAQLSLDAGGKPSDCDMWNVRWPLTGE